MGNTKNAFGKPIYDDTYSFPQDSQDAVDFADEFANVRRGANSERLAAAPGKLKEGLLWVESDTGAIYEWRTATGWKVVHVPDTGWKPIGGLATGWTVQTGDSLDWRVVSGVLYMRGRLNATTGAPQLNVLTTPLPPEARPISDSPRLVGTTGGSGKSYVVSVNANGQMAIYKGSDSILNLPLEGASGIPVG